jgi:predicted MFS family arabinose efflux permease
VWGVVHGAGDGWTSAGVLSTLVGGLALLGAFVAWEHRTGTPMLPMRLFRSRSFSVVIVVTFTFSVGVFGSVFLLAQFFQVVQGLTPLQSGVRTMPWTMAPMVVAPLAGIFADRVGLRNLIVAGQISLAAGVFWIGAATSTTVDYSDLVIAFVLAGIGMGLTFAPISTMALASTDPNLRGVASGANNTIRELGVAVGVAVLASVFSSNGSYASQHAFVDGIRPAVMVGAAIIAVGAVGAAFLPGKSRN